MANERAPCHGGLKRKPTTFPSRLVLTRFFRSFYDPARDNRTDETENGYCYGKIMLKIMEGFNKRFASRITEDNQGRRIQSNFDNIISEKIKSIIL